MTDRWLDIFKWVLNVIVYSTWPDADITKIYANKEFEALYNRRNKTNKSSRRKKLNDQLRGLEPRKRTVLGAGVKLIERGDTDNGLPGQGTGKKLEVHSLVRGHWRRYHVGKGRAEMVWRFIAPHWRGPDSGREGSSSKHELR
jgi:hypothetical protein